MKIFKEFFGESPAVCQQSTIRYQKDCAVVKIENLMILTTAIEIDVFSTPSEEDEGFHTGDRQSFPPGVHLLNSSSDDQHIRCNGATFRVPKLTDSKSVIWREATTKTNIERKVLQIQSKIQQYWVSFSRKS